MYLQLMLGTARRRVSQPREGRPRVSGIGRDAPGTMGRIVQCVDRTERTPFGRLELPTGQLHISDKGQDAAGSS